MIFAIVMAGGKGTRLNVPLEKPLFKLNDKFLIEYVLDNLQKSKLIDRIFIAVSPHTSKTREFCKSLNKDFKVIDTLGASYLEDLSFILSYFEEKSLKDTLLFINADLPFISTEIIDFVLNKYKKSNIDAMSTLVPVEIFEKFNLDYSYDFNGLVPSGLNILRSENIVQDEEQLVISKLELAININTLDDANLAVNFLKIFNK